MKIGKMNASPATKLVYLYLLQNGDDMYDQKEMAQDIGISDRIVRRAIRQLEYLNLLETRRQHTARMSKGWGKLIYKINKENEIFTLSQF